MNVTICVHPPDNEEQDVGIDNSIFKRNLKLHYVT